MPFKDHFSGHADVYAEARPDYPAQLYAYLAGLCEERELAWDCATGNGQAASSLADYFVKVVASDASKEQLARATRRQNIDYRHMLAESPQLAPGSVDLVTVAQALHWFDTSKFFAAVDRILKPCGIFAVWSYGKQTIDPECDAVVEKLYGDIVGEFWPPERRLVERAYEDIEFPFTGLDPEPFTMCKEWDMEQLLSYLSSWSAVQRYLACHGDDPLQLVERELRQAWGDGKRRAVSWPLTLQVRRK